MHLSVRGVSKLNLENLREVILDENPMDRIISFLNSVGFSGKEITLLLAKYKDEAEEIVTENPYRLVEEITGIGFKTADKVGKALDFGDEHPYRVEAYVSDRYKDLAWNQGHSFITKDQFYQKMTSIDRELLNTAFDSLLEKEILILEDDRLYHHTQYKAEKTVSDFLNEFNQQSYDMYSEDFETHLGIVEHKLKIDFGETQKEAIEIFLKENISILTGGPGTGKSTLLSGIVSYLQLSYPNYHISLCAPTGRAAKRLKELTNVSASTIHSILKWNIDTNEFGHDAHNPLDTDILIIDEFSMVDIWLFEIGRAHV